MKRILSLLLSVTICLSLMIIPVSAENFVPIDTSSENEYELALSIANQALANEVTTLMDDIGSDEYVLKFDFNIASDVSYGHLRLQLGNQLVTFLPALGSNEIRTNDNGNITALFDAGTGMDYALDLNKTYTFYAAKQDNVLTYAITSDGSIWKTFSRTISEEDLADADNC